jgi:EAL domain-containing protein (putative c-di-GMP-specific phosphodiesterase class I)/ActR/RegA family two-component response regulator
MKIKHILVVEDDLFQQKILKTMLQKTSDASVHIVNNGKQAIDYLTAGHQPNLILCDLNMPEMDGIELLRRLAQKETNAYIVLSSSVAPDLQQAVMRMANYYGLQKITNLNKPININKLKKLFANLPKEQVYSNKCQIQISDNEIINAFSDEQFLPHFQAHFEQTELAITGAEALIRWQHPEHGLLTPYYFLDRIYQLNLGSQLTKMMLEYSICCCANWHKNGYPLHISVNVSHSDLADVTFTDMALSLLAHYQLQNRYLTIEVTETELSPNLAQSLESLTRLRLNGVEISIDDFGTGHSSLSQLIYSPFTELKIDQSFTNNMMLDNKQMAAVKGSIAIAKSLDLRIVAEGVENQATQDALIEMGCDLLQGYYLSKPICEPAFSLLYKKLDIVIQEQESKLTL